VDLLITVQALQVQSNANTGAGTAAGIGVGAGVGAGIDAGMGAGTGVGAGTGTGAATARRGVGGLTCSCTPGPMSRRIGGGLAPGSTRKHHNKQLIKRYQNIQHTRHVVLPDWEFPSSTALCACNHLTFISTPHSILVQLNRVCHEELCSWHTRVFLARSNSHTITSKMQVVHGPMPENINAPQPQ